MLSPFDVNSTAVAAVGRLSRAAVAPSLSGYHQPAREAIHYPRQGIPSTLRFFRHLAVRFPNGYDTSDRHRLSATLYLLQLPIVSPSASARFSVQQTRRGVLLKCSAAKMPSEAQMSARVAMSHPPQTASGESRLSIAGRRSVSSHLFARQVLRYTPADSRCRG